MSEQASEKGKGKARAKGAAKTVAILATLDTKAREAQFLREQLEAMGSQALIVDVGVLGEPGTRADVTREQIALAGGVALADLQRDATREAAAPVMAEGALATLRARLAEGTLHGVLGLGGLQGTALCTQVMRALPYGLPKVMVSTVASGDVSAYVDIKDIAMLFSVGDIVGLNAFTRRILANAAGAVHGMAQVGSVVERRRSDKPVIGMTNLGVLTAGALRALARFEERGYEVVVFHAVGSGGRAMEQLMQEGIVGAVFDYALGEITDELFGGLRAANAQRLTVAGSLGLPQVIVPGGAEHVGVLVPTAHHVPDRWKEHVHVFHNPVVFVPRLRADEIVKVAREIAKRLASTKGDAVFMIPLRGTGRYAAPGGPLRDEASDRAFFAELKAKLPKTVEVVERDAGAEDPTFVDEAVDRLIGLIEARR